MYHFLNYLSMTHPINQITLLMPVAKLPNTKRCKNPEKSQKPWHMGTHLRALSKIYPKNTSMTGF